MAMNNGGPAFPIPGGSSPFKPDNGYDGMSLRDWFAGQALAGQIASITTEAAAQVMMDSPDPWAWAAESAYKFADAMLATRQSDAEGEG